MAQALNPNSPLVDLPPRSVQDRRFKKDLIKVLNYPNHRTSIWCSQRFKTRAAKKTILWKICLQGEVICVPSPQLTSLDSVFWQSKVLQGYSYDHAYPDYSINTTAFHSTLAAVWFCCMKERRGTFIQVSLHQRFWIFRLDYSVVQDFHMCGDRWFLGISDLSCLRVSEVTWLIAVTATLASTGNRLNK